MTLRALVVGLFCVLALSGLVSYSDLGSSIGWMGGSHLPAGTVGLFLILLLLNGLLGRRWRLRPSEWILVYGMMLVGGLLPSFGLSGPLIPCLVGLNYFATPANRWATLFYPHIPSWLVPFDPGVHELQTVARDFYEGLHYGEPLPWRPWLVPLGAWTVFAFLLFALLFCLAVILRRQWIHHEKLAFPLVQLPLELIQAGHQPGEGESFWRSRVVWLGFALPALLHGMNGLHVYFPFVPGLPVQINLNPYFPLQPWNQMGYTTLFLSFSVVGFSYLIPLDIAFSFWFFFLLTRLEAVVASAYGMVLEPMPLFPAHLFIGFQALGGSVVFALYMLWTARVHLQEVGRTAWAGEGKDPGPGKEGPGSRAGPPEDEPLSARSAVLGLLGCLLLLAGWCRAAGMDYGLALAILVGLVLFLILVLTRCVSAAGLLMIQGLFRPTDLWAMFTSRANLGARNLTLLALIDPIFIRDLRGSLLPTFLDVFKMGERGKLKGRWLLATLVGAIVVGTGASYFLALNRIYRRGGLALGGWLLMSNPQIALQDTAALLQNPPDPLTKGLVWSIGGALFTLFLLGMRNRFLAWPFHPLGYIMGGSWSLILFWFPFFVGWLAKGLILRYGGARLFVNARPFFLGLILGEFSMAVMWALVSAVTGVRGPMIPVS